MYTIPCVIELLKAACPSTLPLKINYCITTRYPSLFDAGGFIPSLHSFLVTLLVQPNRAKALSVCSKLVPLPYKSSGVFQKINALVYVLKLTVCIDTEEIGGDTRESNRAFDVENILSFPNIDDIAVKVKEYIRVLMQLRSRPLIYPQSYPLLTCIV